MNEKHFDEMTTRVWHLKTLQTLISWLPGWKH